MPSLTTFLAASPPLTLFIHLQNKLLYLEPNLKYRLQVHGFSGREEGSVVGLAPLRDFKSPDLVAGHLCGQKNTYFCWNE